MTDGPIVVALTSYTSRALRPKPEPEPNPEPAQPEDEKQEVADDGQ
jgi:hypothetical protein